MCAVSIQFDPNNAEFVSQLNALVEKHHVKVVYYQPIELKPLTTEDINRRLDEAEAQFAVGGGVSEDTCRQMRHNFIQNLRANDSALVQ